jgi:hypothetical protein
VRRDIGVPDMFLESTRVHWEPKERDDTKPYDPFAVYEPGDERSRTPSWIFIGLHNFHRARCHMLPVEEWEDGLDARLVAHEDEAA